MSVLSNTVQKQVEDKLVGDGLFDVKKLRDLKSKAEAEGTPLFSYLVHGNYLSSEVLTKMISHANKVPYVNLTNARIDPTILNLIPADVAERYMAVPLGEMQHRIVVAMLDADNVQAADFLANKVGRPLKVYAASEEGIKGVLKQYGAQISDTMAKAFDDAPEIEELTKKREENNIENQVQDSPISKALSTILDYAARNRASDVHIEPLEKEIKVRCRIDGVLREIMKLPKSTEAPLVSRIKILSNLKIDEHRVPQDGQFTIHLGPKDIDLRIAISPTVWGEQVVIRLLDKTGTSLHLEDMGFRGRALRTIRKGLTRPNGMILTSGPTGSGKSTSLYALLQEIKSDTVNIVTLEDPVEYKMEGINQIQVNPEVGLTFATGLRSILRQDPDIVMVGEIRDKETAQLAVQAALTGHLVFSTLHTNSAAGILPRLLDMGIEPFLIASTVHTVIGQRLVRRIPEDGSEKFQSNVAETGAILQTVNHLLPKSEAERKVVEQDLGFKNLPLKDQKAYTLTKGKDRPDAPGGYKGRMGLYEVFEVNEMIQQMIMKRTSAGEINKAALAGGMLTMRQDGYLKALDGQTSLAEIDRVTAENSA